MALSQQRRDELQKQELLRLAKHGEPVSTTTWFPYTSGQVGSYYIQSVGITADGFDFHEAMDAVVEMVVGTVGPFDAIFGGETRDWAFSFPLADRLRKPHTMLFKDRKSVGYPLNGRFIGMSDLNNEGSSYRDLWLPQIVKAGATLVHAFFYVDRQEEGVHVLEGLNVPSTAVVRMDGNAWQVLKNCGRVRDEEYRSHMERLEDRTAWAHAALRNHPQQLVDMLRGGDARKRQQGEKILNVGYPEIRDEILALMRERFGYQHTFQEQPTGGTQ